MRKVAALLLCEGDILRILILTLGFKCDIM
jgi:hypothetical protein